MLNIEIKPCKRHYGNFILNINDGNLSGMYSFQRGINCLVRKDGIYRADNHIPPTREEFEKMIVDFRPCFYTTLEKEEKAKELFRSAICD